jgi:hypothetical protein
MLSDPQSVKPTGGSSVSLPTTGRGIDKSIYTSADGNTVLTISHTLKSRRRYQARLDFSKIAADPLISAQNIKYSLSAYLVIDVPVTGFTTAEAMAQVGGLLAYLSASTNAKVTSILGNET